MKKMPEKAIFLIKAGLQKRSNMKASFFFMITVLFFTYFIIKGSPKENSPSIAEELVNITLAKAAKGIKDRYTLQPCGEGASMPGGLIQKVALCFDTKRPYTKEKLRELLVKASKELLNTVNECVEMQKFIKKPPFTIDNIQIIIYNHDENGRSLYDPEISNAQILQGILSYSSIDSEDHFTYKHEYEESYEEALKALSRLYD